MSLSDWRLVPTTVAPTPFLYREVRPNWAELFKNLAQLVSKCSTGNWQSLLPDFTGAMSNLFRLKTRSLEEEVFLLVKKSLVRAVGETTRDAFQRSETGVAVPLFKDANRIDLRLQEEPIELTAAFFANPGRARIVGRVAGFLAGWLRMSGIATTAIESQVMHFPAIFVKALADELQENPEDYKKVVESHQPRFRQLTDQNWSWYEYYTKLQERADPEVLDLGVSLDDVYVELRAYTMPSTEGTGGIRGDRSRIPRRIGRLADLADAWLEDRNDPIFVLSGGPGSGKSAFCRRFAAQQAWNAAKPWRVLYVPLHRFKAWSDLKPALDQFAASEIDVPQPAQVFSYPGSDERLLVIFDGLDELSQQGRVGGEVATQFYQALDGFAKEMNGDRRPVTLKCMVSGRPVSVSETDADVRNPERVRYLLPYHIPSEFHWKTEWHGLISLSKDDQRDEWWRKYGQASNHPEICGLPESIRTENLDPLTAEPILNGLVAKCMKDPEHKITKETNRARIYEWMLEDVLRRVHDSNRRAVLSEHSTGTVAVLLEQVAITAWHSGDVRATTKTKVKEDCEKFGLTEVLDRVFPDKAKSDITPIFLAFYFQEAHERVGMERAFEFSHKTYGEYLVARRFKRFLELLHKSVEQESWTNEESLNRWVGLFGPAELTPEIYRFVRDIMDLEEPNLRARWRNDLVRLFKGATSKGMPLHLSKTTYQEMSRQDRNATAALFLVHSACFRLEEPTFSVDWPNRIGGVARGDMLIRLIGHPVSASAKVTRYLEGWDWRGIDLTGAYLNEANLSLANLEAANLHNASCFGANFCGANLSNANLTRVEFGLANLSQANLSNATFLEGNLLGVNFSRVNLRGANFRSVNLTAANLGGADLTGTQLRMAILERANLGNATLSLANLTRANLTGANLSGANLAGGDFGGAIFLNAIVNRANVGGANLANATISRDQLNSTVGDPKLLPNGKPPRTKSGKRKTAKKSESQSSSSDGTGLAENRF